MPRDILRLHLKQWKVLACTSELNEYSPRAKDTKTLPSRQREELNCDTGTAGQRRSDSNIELVRFLDSHEGDRVHTVFASVQLL